MEAVWVAGCSSYETTGVIHLLSGCGISAELFRPGEQLRTRDTLILCFSSAPFLGWWRYLKITQWVMHRYDIQLIVLCPDEVHRAGIVCGRNTVVVNGERSCIHLSRSLQQAVQRRLPEAILAPYRECVRLFFLERAVQTLRIHPAGESDCPAARRAYYRRYRIVQRLGFISLLKLKVFMAGFVG
ncbi:hypothetical protein C6O39_21035 [Salmonella enterica]|uniref:Uncharacterized protein n=3 Tax=Enterobacteriaceae TaxID=543 RepID=A0A376KQS3_ECOLX|nr:hypothetical protein [Salmonella enterica]EAW1956127.1 hypothetical protein [Salmonella enterica subsp. enterica]EBH3853695.1 hypothetical protein [Salmonella enterica subsp. diarizonae]EBH8060999.1 hypothetical protein [Salmonella bongori]EBH9878135.1 hypothetical protein [Salmonella enterica subsp. enterica serovar 6,7:-1,5]EBT7754589.1 hypothetical protein [Salmonella enterica subsp. diarizonae serovar 61:k:1,5,7]ECT4111431.1 hypothetical protein [Salmonella enterica subsp. diarizonae s